jgi:aconitate hydratase
MGLTIAQKIIKAHLISGEMTVGSEIALRIDQTLTQDATGTMAYLEFESMGIDRVRTERSVAYIDHNTLQSGFENADDHRFIQSFAKKHGITSPVREMVFVIRFIWSASVFPERR